MYTLLGTQLGYAINAQSKAGSVLKLSSTTMGNSPLSEDNFPVKKSSHEIC